MPQDLQQTDKPYDFQEAVLERGRKRLAEEKPKRPYIADDPVEDLGNVFQGLWEGIKFIPKAILDILSDPKEYARNVRYLFHPGVMGEVGSVLLDSVTENYKDEEGNIALGQAVVQRPFSTLLDLTVVLSIAGRSAAMAGKLAGGVSRLKIPAEILAKLGPLTRADRLVSMGERVANSPSLFFRAAARKAGGTKIAQSFGDAFGLGSESKALGAIKATEYSSEGIAASEDILKIASRGLAKKDGDLLRRAVRVGAEGDIAALSPQARKWYDSFSNIVETEEAYLKERGLLSERRAFLANAKAAALELYKNPDRWKEAATLMQDKKIRPIYASLFQIREARGLFSELTEGLTPNIRRLSGKYGRLEKRTGYGAYEKDIVQVAMRQVRAFHTFKGRIRFLDRALDHMERKGLVRVVKRTEDLPEGYSVVPRAVYKKYFDAEQRAASVLWRERMRGATTEEAIRKAFSETISDPYFRKEIREANIIGVPTHVASYIAQELSLPGPLGLVYDKLFRYWKAAATVFRPQYWLSVATSNGILAAFHGAAPEDLAKIKNLKNVFPSEIRSRTQTEIAMAGMNAYERVARNFGEYASGMDNMLRQVVFAKEARDLAGEASAVHDRLMKVGANAYAAFDVASDPAKFAQMAAAGPEKLSEAATQVRILYEQVSLRDAKIRKMSVDHGILVNSLKTAKPEQLYDLMEKVANSERIIKTAIARTVEGLVKAGKIEQKMPELAMVAKWADDMIVAGNRLAGSWIRLHPFERKFVSRLVPFYAYTKAINLFLARLPFLYPKRIWMWNRWSQMVMDMTKDPDYPDWLKPYLPVGHAADGSTVFVRLESMLPWAGVRTGEVAQVPIPNILDVVQQNPLIKVMFEMKGGPNQWTKRPWSPDETMTRMDNGEVYQWKDGKLVKTIVQPSLWRSLWYMNPVSQLIETALVPYMMTDRGWLGYPEAIRKPNGEAMFPRELLDRVGSFFGPRTVTVNLEEARQRERSKFYRLVREYRKDMRYATPEQREAMLEILRDNLRIREERFVKD